jgi:hypothetical protein
MRRAMLMIVGWPTIKARVGVEQHRAIRFGGNE